MYFLKHQLQGDCSKLRMKILPFLKDSIKHGNETNFILVLILGNFSLLMALYQIIFFNKPFIDNL
jgi:hypothetical protein